MSIEAASLSIAALRSELGLSLEVFAARIGVSSKGRMSEIERGKVPPTAEQALRIEAMAEGRIDAARLHPTIAAAREAITNGAAQCWNLSGLSAAVLCDVCDRRAGDPVTEGCTSVICGLRVKEAA